MFALLLPPSQSDPCPFLTYVLSHYSCCLTLYFDNGALSVCHQCPPCQPRTNRLIQTRCYESNSFQSSCQSMNPYEACLVWARHSAAQHFLKSTKTHEYFTHSLCGSAASLMELSMQHLQNITGNCFECQIMAHQAAWKGAIIVLSQWMVMLNLSFRIWKPHNKKCVSYIETSLFSNVVADQCASFATETWLLVA